MRDFYMTQNFFQSSGKNRRFVGYLDYDAEEAIRIKNAADRLHEIESYFPAGRQLRILEIAGGYGALTKLAGDRGHDATAIDFSRVMVDGARERYGISVIHADFMTHDFADARFDAVVLYGALGNFPDVTGAGRKIGTLLRSGGLYFTNFIEPRSIIERIQGPDFWLYRPPIIGIWTADAFAQAHQEFGFTLEKRLADVQWVSIGKLVGYLQSPAIRALARAMWIERLNLKLPTPGYVKVILRRK